MKKNKIKTQASKTGMIKSKAYNKIQRYFHPKDELSKIASGKKIEAIENILLESRKELYNYRQKRKKKAIVEKFRQEKRKQRILENFPEFKEILQNANGNFEELAKTLIKDKYGVNKTKKLVK